MRPYSYWVINDGAVLLKTRARVIITFIVFTLPDVYSVVTNTRFALIDDNEKSISIFLSRVKTILANLGFGR